MKYALVALLLLAGCNTSERRLLILHEAKLVLRNSWTSDDFQKERAVLEQHLQEEDPDEAE